jgi:TPR repeat protein
MYYNSWGVPQDYATAMSWYSKAAEQGDAVAHQYNLGIVYANGRGVPQDYATAVGLVARAKIGVMYYRARVSRRTMSPRTLWLNLAAVSGDKDAVKLRDMVAAQMTPAQIAEAQKLAREWKPK